MTVSVSPPMYLKKRAPSFLPSRVAAISWSSASYLMQVCELTFCQLLLLCAIEEFKAGFRGRFRCELDVNLDLDLNKTCGSWEQQILQMFVTSAVWVLSWFRASDR